MSTQSMLVKDPYYLDERRKQCQKIKEVFTKELAYYFSIMPAPARVFNRGTGEWTVINDHKWQVLIDKKVEMANEYLQKEFPEFNNQEKY